MDIRALVRHLRASDSDRAVQRDGQRPEFVWLPALQRRHGLPRSHLRRQSCQSCNPVQKRGTDRIAGFAGLAATDNGMVCS